MGFQAGQAVSRIGAAVSAVAGTKAGQNHYAMNGDLSEAAWRGAIAGRRWFVWSLGCVAWCVMVLITFCIYMGNAVDRQDARMYGGNEGVAESQGMLNAWLLSLPIVLLFLLVIYKRNIDFGLHRRKALYNFARTLSPFLAWAPNWLLYAGFAIVPITLQFVF